MSDTIATRRTLSSVIILDAQFAPQLVHPGGGAFEEQRFRDAAKQLVEDRRDQVGVTVEGVDYIVRAARLEGPERYRYAMFVERRGSRRPLLDAYERFGLSAREVEVLGLIVDGASNRRIAETLCITAGTVQDHVHSLCRKCGAKRRGDLLARVFGLEGG